MVRGAKRLLERNGTGRFAGGRTLEAFGPKLQSPGGYIGSLASRGGIFLSPTALSFRRAAGAPVGIVLGAATGMLVKLLDGLCCRSVSAVASKFCSTGGSTELSYAEVEI